MRRRRGWSVAEKAALWSGWKRGLSLAAIGKSLGRNGASVFGVVRAAGGYEPRQRRRSSHSLRWSEREEISRGLAAGESMRSIARKLGRPASTVSREIARHGGLEAYRAEAADRRAGELARRPQRCLLARRPRLRAWVARKLQRDWSPRQIAVGLRRAFPQDEGMRVSHETVYRSLFVQARGVLKAELQGHLRRGDFMRRARGRSRVACDGIVDGVSIRARPAEAEDRAVPGHWEGDLLMGGNSSQVATLVEE